MVDSSTIAPAKMGALVRTLGRPGLYVRSGRDRPLVALYAGGRVWREDADC